MVWVMARKNQSLFFALLKAPWWVSVLLSAFTYVSLTILTPALFPPRDEVIAQAINNGLVTGIQSLAPFIAIILLIPAPFSLIKSYQFKHNFKTTNTQDDITSMNWIEFEGLVGEYYRHQGYKVKQNLSHAPDGGVDIELFKNGKITLVQCKHWKARKVGVSVLRELYGVLLDRKAEKMVVVTSGEFTLDAQRFALHKGFELIHGTLFIDLLNKAKNAALTESTPLATEPLTCPQCQSQLVLRTAMRGPHLGKQFYGCSGFPKCRFILTK